MYDKLQNYHHYTNKIWKAYVAKINYPKITNHIFLNDMDFVDKLESENPEPIINKEIHKKVNMNTYFKLVKHIPVPTEVLPEELVRNVFDILTKNHTDRSYIPEWTTLEPLLAKFSDYLLYSNINLEKISEMFQNKSSNALNILIMGAGPTGLYIANYLRLAGPMFPFFNLAIIDDRIPGGKRGLRLPYTRNRIFGLDFSLFSSFFPIFPCIRGLVSRGGIEIKYLENFLLVLAYSLNIPIYFTDEISNEMALKKFILKNKIDIVFDCTGGRMDIDYSSDIKSDFFPSNLILENDKYDIVRNRNKYELHWKKNIHNKFWLSIEIYDSDGKFLFVAMNTESLLFEPDVILLYKLHNKNLRIKDTKIQEAIDLFDNLKDLGLSKKIQTILSNNYNHIIKFYIIEPKLHHTISISKIIRQPKLDTIIIGTGDTIFSSHFVIGAGLNRLLPFINNIIWYIQTFY
jgi:hypothetical protein